jgi:hypothetical protein
MSSMFPSTATGTHAAFIAATKPATSAGVSPFRRISISALATCMGSAPSSTPAHTSCASPALKWSPSSSFSM